jgi:transcriptional regulator with XRE-family HTH domain
MKDRICEIVAKYFGGNVSAFAEAIGVSQSAANQIVKGKVNPSASTLESILANKKLKISPTWLMKGVGEMSDADRGDVSLSIDELARLNAELIASINRLSEVNRLLAEELSRSSKYNLKPTDSPDQ